MEEKRKEDLRELAIILNKLDTTSLMLVKSNAEILFARDKLEEKHMERELVQQ